jgi:flagellar secretion chaperone FliS
MFCGWQKTSRKRLPDKEPLPRVDKRLWEHTMWNNGHDAYLESRVLAASPLELVHMLYEACMQAVRDARHCLREGDIAGRSRAITKACEILIELNGSLDLQRGGEIAQRLAQLYDYMQVGLLEANMNQMDEPLAGVLGLLATLEEAWDGVRPAPGPTSTERMWSCSAEGEAIAAHAWSF